MLHHCEEGVTVESVGPLFKERLEEAGIKDPAKERGIMKDRFLHIGVKKEKDKKRQTWQSLLRDRETYIEGDRERH